MSKVKNKIQCPTCGEKDTWLPDNESKPFCSYRCKLIDLGEWADEGHKIAGELMQLNEPGNEDD